MALLAVAAAACDNAPLEAWRKATSYGKLDLAEVCCAADSVLTEEVQKAGGRANRYSDWNGYDLTKKKGAEKLYQDLLRDQPRHVFFAPPCGPESIMQNANQRTAELTNRFRTARELHPGQRVLIRDPKLSKEVAGKTAWRRPLPPGTVVEVRGRKATVRRDDGALLKDLHLENLVELPLEVDDWEDRAAKPDLEGEDARPQRDRVDERRSPGQLMEDPKPLVKEMAAQKAKVKGLQVGVYLAYAAEGPRRMRVGRRARSASRAGA